MKTTDAFRVVSAALAGAAVGAAVALLFAPEDGRRFRRRVGRGLREQAGEAMRKGRDVLAEAGERLEEEVEAACRKAARVVGG